MLCPNYTIHFIFCRCSAEVLQFAEGMNAVGGLWGTVCSNKELFEPQFCHNPPPLDKASFEALFTVDYSEEGSSRRQLEADTIYAWEVFLQDVADGSVPVTFQDILTFITGANKIPPCGFHGPLEIVFFPQETDVNRLPSVSTCALQINLPSGIRQPEVLSTMMVKAIKESCGFDKI